MHLKKYIILSLLLIFCQTIFAQNFKKVLSRPFIYKQPLFDVLFENFSITEKEKNVPWIVICDRDDTKTYDKPNGIPQANINFKDWFYVLKETKDWIQIGKAKISSGTRISGKAESYGWVEKKNLLLWTSGLLDTSTRIHKKAFYNNEKIHAFKGPLTGLELGKINNQNLYFIIKEENNRALLAKTSRLSPNQLTEWDENLVGWVRTVNLIAWNTRLCLEPNFTKEAFEERRNNPDFKLRAYPALEYAINHQIDKIIQNVGWDIDKVIIDSNLNSTHNFYRLKGEVFRFPFFSSSSVHSFQSYIVSEFWNEHNSQLQFINDETNNRENELRKEVYLPKHINGAKYPTHSFVLFMSKEELEQYILQIEKIEFAMNGTTVDDMREILYNMFLELLSYYTGSNNERNHSKLSTADLRRIMQGLEREGMESLERSTDFKIEDIMSPKKMNDEAVRTYVNQILSNSKKISKALNEGKNYEFSYILGDNAYYWIPIDWTF